MPTDDVIAALGRSATRFHAAALATGPAHHVASPLGAWIVLALAADALEGGARVAAADVLGVDVEAAGDLARALLDEPHPAVAAAVACWVRADAIGARLDGWTRRLPRAVAAGAVPTQAEADRWAAERTAGQVARFPVAVDPQTVLVLASALATEVAWAEPYTAVGSDRLGGPWAGRVERVLERSGPTTYLTDTAEAGLVAVARAHSTTDLEVISVSAAPDVAPVAVIEAAHRVADPTRGTSPRSLFDVPLGAGPSWVLDEVQEHGPSYTGRAEEATVVLPAWTATSEHRLLADERFGFGDITAQLLAALPHHPDGWEADAGQAAVATYGRVGFSAAAVTAMAARAGAGAPEPRPIRVRRLTARFAHPHAVVAVAHQRGGVRPGPWDGLPVFSAWVAEPSEVTD